MIGDQYRVLKKIGQGGIGAVYQAEDENLIRIVAVKVLQSNLTPVEVARFQREAQATGQLNHPNIIQTLNFGISTDGKPFLVMEFLNGESLSSFIQREKPLSISTIEVLTNQICSALRYSHEHGIVHRDLKPSNVMLVTNDKGEICAKLVDFGLAQREDDSQHLTRTGYGIGSPGYMSPEQVQGVPADERTDIYALGCVLFELCTGHIPIEDDSAFEIMSRKLWERAPLLSDVVDRPEVSELLDDVVAKCLEIEPSERYASVADVQKVLASKFASLSEGVVVEQPDAQSGRKKVVLVLSGLCAVVVLCVVSVYLVVKREAQQSQIVINKAYEQVDAKSKIMVGIKGLKDEWEDGFRKFVYIRPTECKTYRGAVDEDLKILARYPRMSKLQLATANISGVGLKPLKGLPITEIKLTNTCPSLEGIKAVTAFKGLRVLELGTCPTLTDQQIEILSRHKVLEDLIIKETPITDASLKSLSRMKSLKLLDISRVKNVTEVGATQLIKAPNLEALYFGSKTTTPAFFKAIARSTKLRAIRIEAIDDPEVLRAGLKELRNAKGLKFLQLARLNVPNDIGRQLLPLGHLETLTFNSVQNLNREAIESLAPLRLKKLNLDLPYYDLKSLAACVKLRNLQFLEIKVKSENASPGFMAFIQELTKSLPNARVTSVLH